MSSVFRSTVLMTAVAIGMPTMATATTTPASQPASVASTTMTDKQKNSYMIGMDMAKSLGQIKDEIDITTLTQALLAAFNGKPTALTQAQAEEVRKTFSQRMQAKMAAQQNAEGQKNLEAGKRFLASNKTKPGVHTTTSGLQYQVLRQGAGTLPKPSDKVRVHYKGTLLNGETFDSSYERGQPAEFALNQVIPGWTEGVALMPVGSKYKLWIPSNLAYGANGQPPIGPNSTLVFEVELLDIVK